MAVADTPGSVLPGNLAPGFVGEIELGSSGNQVLADRGSYHLETKFFFKNKFYRLTSFWNVVCPTYVYL